LTNNNGSKDTAEIARDQIVGLTRSSPSNIAAGGVAYFDVRDGGASRSFDARRLGKKCATFEISSMGFFSKAEKFVSCLYSWLGVLYLGA